MADQEAYFNLGLSSEQDLTMRNYFSMFPEEVIASVLDAFIINRPKSGKVGGDGFWVHQAGDELIIALFDCMGEGHLASMMARVYTQLLDKIVKQDDVTDPGTILRYLHHHVEVKFSGKKNLKVSASAEFAIINVNIGVRKLEYSGAGIGLVQFTGNELTELAADKLPIGSTFDQSRNYQTQHVKLKEGIPSHIYLATDGICEQIGGSNSSKLGKAAVFSLFKEIQDKPMINQKVLINKYLEDWQGYKPQTDDMLILGLAI